jgi:hypothetical protein
VNWLDKKLVGAFAITLTAIVLTVGLSRCDFSQLNQILAPSPTPTPSPTQTPTPTPSPTEQPTDVTSKPSVPEFTLQMEDELWLRVIIQNQPFIPNGHDSAGIYYTTRFKWHESADWYPPESEIFDGKYHSQRGNLGTTEWLTYTNGFYELLGTSDSNQLDYQIMAINGYKTLPSSGIPIGVEPWDYPVNVVNTSGWSNTQTITIP